jgi:hypothetical protein
MSIISAALLVLKAGAGGVCTAAISVFVVAFIFGFLQGF